MLLDPERLASYDLSPQRVVGAIQSSAVDVPAGSLSFGNDRVLLAGRSTPSTVRAVEEIRVDPVKGVRVVDVGTVRDAASDVSSYARLDGEPVVPLDSRKLSGSNSVGTADNVRGKLASFDLPAGYQYQIVGDTTTFVKSSVIDTLREMVLAAAAVSLIVLLFVGRLGSVFAVVLAIPVSLAGALVTFSFFGFTFNIITLLAITVAIGLVVDDAIVVAENIDRYREMGYSIKEAVLHGAGDVSTAVLAATMSLLAVFIPISFLPGIIGQFFAQFGITMAATIAFSYLEAMFFLTVRLALSPDPLPPGWREVPKAAARGAGDVRSSPRLLRSWLFWLVTVAAAVLLWRQAGPVYAPLALLVPVVIVLVRYLGRLVLTVLGAIALTLFRGGDRVVALARNGYVASLRAALRRPWIVLAIAAGLFASLFWVFPKIGFNFQPPTDSGQLVVSLALPVGTSLDRTNAVATRIENDLMADPVVRTVQTTVGSGSILGGSNTQDASFTVDLVGKKERQLSSNELAVAVDGRLHRALADVPEADINVGTSDPSSAPGTTGYSMNLGSNDLTLLLQRADRAVTVLQDNPGLRNVRSDVAQTANERVFVADAALLDGTGLTKADVYGTLRSYNVGVEAGKLRQGGEELPIRVRADPADLRDEQSLLSLPLYAPALQTSLPLSALGHFETREAPASISRLNQSYSATITADLAPGAQLSTVQAQARAELTREGILDARVTEVTGGNFDLLGDLLLYGPIAFALALLLNYLAIGSQFNSFRYPIYLLLTVPLALVGAVWLFYLTGSSLDVISILGVIMLVGLVTKNAILLLDVTMQQVRQGTALREALTEAGRVRFRPIVMTTLTVVVISVPLLLGIGEGAEFRYPLGLVILGGVLTSALLTFYVVPSAFFQFERKRLERTYGLASSATPPPDAAPGPRADVPSTARPLPHPARGER